MAQKKYYPALLVLMFSLIGMTIPAAVSQFSMSVREIAAIMEVSEQIILTADTVRATCLVIAMFLSGPAYKRLGLKKTIALGLFFQIVPQFALPPAIRAGCLPLLFFFKGLQGCNAVAFPLYISAILKGVSDSKAGSATAIFNGSFIAGNGVGAWLAAKLIPTLGWQQPFYIIGGTCLLLAVPVVLIVDGGGDPAEKRPRCASAAKSSYKEIVKQPATWIYIAASLAGAWVSQAVVVDLPIYSSYLRYDYAQSGNLMFIISAITAFSSILAGFVSDFVSVHTVSKLKMRCTVILLGYVVSAAFAVLLPLLVSKGYPVYAFCAAMLMFGASWANGAIWPLINLIYTREDVVAGTSFCSSAQTVCNPIAPFVTGVLLGSRGHWFSAWVVSSAVSLLSLSACIALYKFRRIPAES